MLPSEVATALLTATVAYGYVRLGIGAVALGCGRPRRVPVPGLGACAGLRAWRGTRQARARARIAPGRAPQHRDADALDARRDDRASLRRGRTLCPRSRASARHSTSASRTSIHTAALLHDIGKFIFPDSILFADRKLTDEEWEIVKLHPEQGAKLVRRIEGYGPVADIIIGHHERVDGKGYPHGIAGEDIPLGSRIISVADTYDVMTSRDSYRRPVSSEAAIVELRRVAGSQLDPKVVEAFVEMVEAGRVAFRHADEADFERELAFERRVADYARPRAAAA